MIYKYKGQEIKWEDKFKCPFCDLDLLIKKTKACAKERFLACPNRACSFDSRSVKTMEENEQ